ncbi:prephenate dehydrogenase/arogenate dehydrogenase family protein [Patescibacteria group bacterium]|nr:prephenate dehydrogenase/arogenate dehydrogenase family protein [Patescibacteria group bacterium]MBU2259960.1 prephenate dehydrogenase/arogenate dehydrogenase family protein [Patescibacteria group bacterium]
MLQESPLTGKTMAVIGGGGGWGAKIARAGSRLGSEVKIIEVDTSNQERDRTIESADTVFFAAPDYDIPKILNETRGLLVGRNVLDCATSKIGFEKDLTALADETSVCSTHPMVRSETPLRDQNAIIMPIGNLAQPATEVAEALFNALHMRLCRFEFSQHVDLAIVQQLPHLIQRVVIDALGMILNEKGIGLGEIGNVAPANFGVTELAAGRVAIQRPDVSAGIISSSLQSPLGQRILEIIQESLGTIVELSKDREALTEYFAESADQLDPDGSWRKEMDLMTDMHVEARANFRRCSLKLEVKEDYPGLLGEISSVFASCNLNMNAIHSHEVEHGDDTLGVRFNIGVDELDDNWMKLEQECQKRGWGITRTKTDK